MEPSSPMLSGPTLSGPTLSGHGAGWAPGPPMAEWLRRLRSLATMHGGEVRALVAMTLLPVFLLPAVGSGGDIARLASGAAGFLALSAGTAALSREDRAAGLGAVALGLGLAASQGSGVLVLALLHLALVSLRAALPAGARLLDLLLGAVALLVVLDAALVTLAVERSASLLLFGGLLALFLAAREDHAPLGLGLREIRLGLTALLLGSFMALLVADPALAPHAGPLAGASVPLLGAALLRACREEAPRAGSADPLLIACLAGWALMMTAALEGLPGF